MSYEDYNDDQELSFFQRNRIAVIAGVVVLLLAVGGVIYKFNSGSSSSSSHSSSSVVMVKLPPPPPPPPPKPVVTPPKQEEMKQEEQKMVDQQPVDDAPPKPDEAPKDEPAPSLDLTSATAGPGDSGMAVAAGTSRGIGSGSGGTIGGTGTGGHHGGKWDVYASSVQSQIKRALSDNPKTRSASLNLQIRLWADANGAVDKVSLTGSTGDASLDNVIKNEVLAGLKLQQPPPKDMPMPIVLRVTAMRPS